MFVTAMSFTTLSAFAAEGPTELVLLNGEDIDIHDGGVYIVSDGTLEMGTFNVVNGTLIIGKSASIKVNDDGDVGYKCTVIVLGSLDIYEVKHFSCDGKIYVDGGKLSAKSEGLDKVINSHCFEDGVCVFCGYECPHTRGYANGKCRDCGTECPHTHMQTKTVVLCGDCGVEVESTLIGSVLSEGSLTVVVGVAAAVVFGLGGFVLGTKKKKPALAEGAEKDEE